MCEICTDVTRENSPEQYVREDYRHVDAPVYIQSTYVGDYIVSTEVDAAYVDPSVGVALLLRMWDDVPAAFSTSVARIGSGTLGEYKEANGFPPLLHTEYSRKQSALNIRIPDADELDVLHESMVARTKAGEFDTL
ncbi:MAG TPA: hypothetical protein VIY48_19125 [Candidatus Paceibacterota bacterium]